MKRIGLFRFFLIYYGISAAAIALSHWAWPRRLRFTEASFLPIIYIVFVVVLAMLIFSPISRALERLDYVLHTTHYSKEKNFHANQDKLRRWYSGQTENQRVATAYLLCIPAAMLLIFLGGWGLKIFGFLLLLLLPPILSSVFGMYADKDLLQQQYEQRVKELEEQKKREELGHWK